MFFVAGIFATAVLLLRGKGLWFNWAVIAAIQVPLAFLSSSVFYTESVTEENKTIRKDIVSIRREKESIERELQSHKAHLDLFRRRTGRVGRWTFQIIRC